MVTMVTQSTRKTVSAVAAIAIVSFGGLVMDQAYLAAAPKGMVEVGELTALDGAISLAQLSLTSPAPQTSPPVQGAAAELPEVVVVAKHVARMVAQDDHAAALAKPSINVGF